jgi:hypothetical protein
MPVEIEHKDRDGFHPERDLEREEEDEGQELRRAGDADVRDDLLERGEHEASLLDCLDHRGEVVSDENNLRCLLRHRGA